MGPQAVNSPTSAHLAFARAGFPVRARRFSRPHPSRVDDRAASRPGLPVAPRKAGGAGAAGRGGRARLHGVGGPPGRPRSQRIRIPRLPRAAAADPERRPGPRRGRPGCAARRYRARGGLGHSRPALPRRDGPRRDHPRLGWHRRGRAAARARHVARIRRRRPAFRHGPAAVGGRPRNRAPARGARRRNVARIHRAATRRGHLQGHHRLLHVGAALPRDRQPAGAPAVAPSRGLGENRGGRLRDPHSRGRHRRRGHPRARLQHHGRPGPGTHGRPRGKPQALPPHRGLHLRRRALVRADRAPAVDQQVRRAAHRVHARGMPRRPQVPVLSHPPRRPPGRPRAKRHRARRALHGLQLRVPRPQEGRLRGMGEQFLAAPLRA